MSTDLSLYQVDLDTAQANGRSGESPRSAFTKYNELVDILEGWNNTYISDSAPSPTYAFQQWIDTSTDPATIKMRDSSDSSWVSLGSYNQSFGTAAGYDASTTSTSGYIPVADSSGKIDDAWIDHTSLSVTLTGEVEGSATFDSTGSVSVDTILNTSSLSEALAAVYTETPSLSIPFNESGRLDYGIGTEYVTGLPLYGVNFTRSTASSVINKSGVIEDLSSNEIAIGPSGAWAHESYTVNPTYTNDLTQSVWSSVSTTVSDSGDTWNGLTVYSIYDSSGNGYRNLRYLANITSGDDIGVAVIARAGTATQFKISIGSDGDVVFDLSTGTFTSYASVNASITKLDGDFYECFASATSTVTSTSYVIKASEFRTTSTTSGQHIDMVYAGFTNKLNKLPPKINSGTSSSITSASFSVPVSGNVPATGNDFTIKFIAEFGNDDDAINTVFSATSASGEVILFRKIRGQIQWFHPLADGSDGSILLSGTSYIEGRHLYSLVFDSGIFNMYCDGELIGSRAPDDYDWFDMDSNITFNSSYNNQIKDFEILTYAASADEVKSWGAPK